MSRNPSKQPLSMGKRLFDIAVSAAALLLLSPLLLAIAVAVRFKLGSPILFRQVRPGLHGRPFTIVKFRTMLGGDLPDAERLTPFGKWLRSTSLDELPELWNVLKGDMSLVGPRPLMMEYLPLYSAEQRKRHDVRPGITGLTAVSGRNALSWDQKFKLDLEYVERRDFWLDLTILRRTVAKVAGKDGISAPGEATMPPFKG